MTNHPLAQSGKKNPVPTEIAEKVAESEIGSLVDQCCRSGDVSMATCRLHIQSEPPKVSPPVPKKEGSFLGNRLALWQFIASQQENCNYAE